MTRCTTRPSVRRLPVRGQRTRKPERGYQGHEDRSCPKEYFGAGISDEVRAERDSPRLTAYKGLGAEVSEISAAAGRVRACRLYYILVCPRRRPPTWPALTASSTATVPRTSGDDLDRAVSPNPAPRALATEVQAPHHAWHLCAFVRLLRRILQKGALLRRRMMQRGCSQECV